MFKTHFKIIFAALIAMVLLPAQTQAQVDVNEQHRLVALRMIGHQILLNAGDSTSRVLPIQNEAGRYKISLETEFEFKPEELAATIDSIVGVTKIANSYIVEVEKCGGGELVYSYEAGAADSTGVMPCGPRAQPKACYNLYITILSANDITAALHSLGPVLSSTSSSPSNQSNNFIFLFLTFILILILGLLGFTWRLRRKSKSGTNPNLIKIGGYLFDKINAELLFGNQRIELTGKEADLLVLLYDAANNTVGREDILKMVWGDEGDYVGRTLDVFISKLRKKLEADPDVKIVNIRGVGYKLVLEE